MSAHLCWFLNLIPITCPTRQVFNSLDTAESFQCACCVPVCIYVCDSVHVSVGMSVQCVCTHVCTCGSQRTIFSPLTLGSWMKLVCHAQWQASLFTKPSYWPLLSDLISFCLYILQQRVMFSSCENTLSSTVF